MEKSIHFKLCHCPGSSTKPHGYFFTAAEEPFPPAPFFSQQAAVCCLKYMNISPEETAALSAEIVASGLPEKVTEADVRTVSELALGELFSKMVEMVIRSGQAAESREEGKAPSSDTVH